MGIATEILAAGFRGLLRELAINPRDLRIQAVLDGETHLLVRLDASTLKELMRRVARKRSLQLKFGNLIYEVEIGSSYTPPFPKAPKQRGGKHG